MANLTSPFQARVTAGRPALARVAYRRSQRSPALVALLSCSAPAVTIIRLDCSFSSSTLIPLYQPNTQSQSCLQEWAVSNRVPLLFFYD